MNDVIITVPGWLLTVALIYYVIGLVLWVPLQLLARRLLAGVSPWSLWAVMKAAGPRQALINILIVSTIWPVTVGAVIAETRALRRWRREWPTYGSRS